MIVDNVQFCNNKNQRIVGRIYKDDPMSRIGVIFCHGLFSSKDAYKITRMAEDIVNAGYTLLTFDFSFVGESEGNISELSVLQEVQDLKSAFLFFEGYGIESVHIIGSSLGGVVSLIFSSENQDRLRTQTIIATPINLRKVLLYGTDIEDIESLPEEGMTAINGIEIRNRFFKEIEHLNIDNAIGCIEIPTLIIHGGMDKSVPVSNARELAENLKSEKRLVIIEDGDHNLTRDSDLLMLKEDIIDWLNKYS